MARQIATLRDVLERVAAIADLNAAHELTHAEAARRAHEANTTPDDHYGNPVTPDDAKEAHP